MNSIGIYTRIQFEDLWFYWNGYPFELFNCEPEWLSQRRKPYFFVFYFYVYVKTSLFIFTNNSDRYSPYVLLNMYIKTSLPYDEF